LSLKLYLDESITNKLFAHFLILAGHDVQVPAEVGLLHASDLAHFNHVIHEQRILITANPDDFEALHVQSQGQHPGIFAVHYDNNPRKDPKLKDLVRAIDNIMKAGMPIAGQYYVLNQWLYERNLTSR